MSKRKSILKEIIKENIMLIKEKYKEEKEKISESLIMIRPENYKYDETIKKEEIKKIKEEYKEIKKKMKEKEIEIERIKKNEIKMRENIICNKWLVITENEIHILTTKEEKEKEKYIEAIKELIKRKYKIRNVVNYNYNEKKLEGRESMVIDKENKTIYCAISKKTNIEKAIEYAKSTKQKIMIFNTKNRKGKAYEKTNEILSIGKEYAIICDEAIINDKMNNKYNILTELIMQNKKIIIITRKQVEENNCGSVIEVLNKKKEKKIIMSERAYKGYTERQKKMIEKYGEIVRIKIEEIEKKGIKVTDIFSEINAEKKKRKKEKLNKHVKA